MNPPLFSSIQIGATWRDPDTWVAAPDPEALAQARDISPDRFTLLIHGWSIGKGEEGGSYIKLLKKIDRGAGGAKIADSILSVSWKSDYRYGTALQIVPRVADALETMLRDPRFPFEGAKEIVLVGHSMGCRIALEIARRLLSKKSDYRPELRLFLMAAAVPVGMVEEGGALHEAATQAEYSCVYHSMTDQAFLLPFSLVQSYNWWDGGDFPEAVGWRGRPQAGVWDKRCSRLGYFHNSYWNCSVVAEDLVRDHRRRTVRAMPEHVMPERN